MQLPHLESRGIRQQAFLLIFIFSYMFLSLLIVEQGRTIASQRALIQQLFSDSLELNALKMKQTKERNR